MSNISLEVVFLLKDLITYTFPTATLNLRCYVCILQTIWSHQWLCSKTGRREVPGSFLGRACQPSRSEFSVVFSETRVNTGQDPLERPLRRAFHLQSQITQANNWTQTYKHVKVLNSSLQMLFLPSLSLKNKNQISNKTKKFHFRKKLFMQNITKTFKWKWSGCFFVDSSCKLFTQAN